MWVLSMDMNEKACSVRGQGTDTDRESLIAMRESILEQGDRHTAEVFMNHGCGAGREAHCLHK